MNKFKPGDKVKFISNSSSNAKYFRGGLTGLEIHFVNNTGIYDYIVWESDKSVSWGVMEDELEFDTSSESSTINSSIPGGNSSGKELLEYAKKNYPIGTKYIPVHVNDGINEVSDTDYAIYLVKSEIVVNSKCLENNYNGVIFYRGKWAKIIELPESVETSDTKFEIGKWYKWYQKDHKAYHYGKVSKISETYFYCEPWISNLKYFSPEGCFNNEKSTEITLLTDLSEIQESLPEGHEDKYNQNQEEEEEVCETCNGEGIVMIAKLYPNGHTEVNEECPNCKGSGYLENELSEFPSEGYCISLDDRLIQFLIFRSFSKITIEKKSEALGVGWNKNSYWYLITSDKPSKPKYKLSQLEKFLPLVSSPKESFKTLTPPEKPKSFVGRWIKWLMDVNPGNFKKGDYCQIYNQDHDENFYLNENPGWCYIKDKIVKGVAQLMPEGFTPPKKTSNFNIILELTENTVCNAQESVYLFKDLYEFDSDKKYKEIAPINPQIVPIFTPKQTEEIQPKSEIYLSVQKPQTINIH